MYSKFLMNKTSTNLNEKFGKQVLNSKILEDQEDRSLIRPAPVPSVNNSEKDLHLLHNKFIEDVTGNIPVKKFQTVEVENRFLFNDEGLKINSSELDNPISSRFNL